MQTSNELTKASDPNSHGIVEVRVAAEFSRMNIVFITDKYGKMYSAPDPEAYMLAAIGEYSSHLNGGDVNVFLGDESVDPRSGPSDGKNTIDFIARQGVKSFLFASRFLFTPEGMVALEHRNGEKYWGNGNIAFRVCDMINTSPLGEPEFYFVAARGLESWISNTSGKFVYINDRIHGLRRMSDGHDTGWLTGYWFQMYWLDTYRVKHYNLNLSKV